MPSLLMRPFKHLPSSMHCRLLVRLLLLTGLCALWQISTNAQPLPPQRNDPDGLTAQAIQKNIDKIRGTEEIDEATKASVLALYQKALEDVVLAGTWESKVQEFEQIARAADAENEAAKASLVAGPVSLHPEISKDATVRELERMLAAAKKSLEKANQRLSSAEVEPRRRAIRRLEVEQLLKHARERLTELKRETGAHRAGGLDGPLEAAQQVQLLAALQAVEQEVLSYVQELAANEATLELLPLNLDLATREVARTKARVKTVEGRVAEARRLEAEAEIDQARITAPRKREQGCHFGGADRKSVV